MHAPRFARRWYWLLAAAVLVGAAALLAACTNQPSTESATPCPDPTECPEVECPQPLVAEVPYAEAWAASGHADAAAEAFTHWNEDDPPEIPNYCAKCHSTPGYLDFLGLDGTDPGAVDNAAPVGTVVTCVACHNEATMTMDTVIFPSGAEVTGLGDEARCMQCHQGRASTASVDEAIAQAGVEDDEVSQGDNALSFINIHYFAAAATKYGTIAQGGYQYAGRSYDAQFDHVEGFQTCTDCHAPHTLEVQVEACARCHEGVASVEDLRNVRLEGSLVDYDSDGDVEEGIYYEIQTLQETLYAAIQAYADDVVGTPIVYDSHTYPYFFTDTNGDGEAGEDEVNYGNQYATWTPRLLRAAYNYQFSMKDPGGYAHGGKYIIQLLYDSTEDLGGDVTGLHRIDPGHFASSEEAFRHWDEEGEVPGFCARCHTAEGLPTYLEEGVNVSEPVANGLLCTTCHDGANWPARYAVEQVSFPSGAQLTLENSDNNLCISCHQGRQSTNSVSASISGLPLDTTNEGLHFLNIHYFAAGATLFGGEASGAYEYTGRDYAGRSEHPENVNECAECHDTHRLEVKEEGCSSCHPGAEEPENIRMSEIDFDGDDDTEEGIAGEIATMHEALYQAIQAYAADVVGTPIVYNAHAYPYFFVDTNGNGVADPDESNYGNRYNAWTPRLLRAAYNYQYVAKDPGGFAHNPTYILQVLYDTLTDIGSTAGMTRP
jgi:hypothetical protein